MQTHSPTASQPHHNTTTPQPHNRTTTKLDDQITTVQHLRHICDLQRFRLAGNSTITYRADIEHKLTAALALVHSVTLPSLTENQPSHSQHENLPCTYRKNSQQLCLGALSDAAVVLRNPNQDITQAERPCPFRATQAFASVRTEALSAHILWSHNSQRARSSSKPGNSPMLRMACTTPHSSALMC